MDPYDFGEGSSQSTTIMETPQVNINETTPVSALSIAEKRKIYNRNYYLRNKENNINGKSVNTQGTSATDNERTTSICSGLTTENFNGKIMHLLLFPSLTNVIN